VVAHPFIIVPVEPFVPPVAALKLVVGHVPLEGHAGHHEMVGAEQFRDLISHVRIQSAHGRTDHHHRRHADDDPDQSQKGAQLMRQDRLQRDARRVGIK
jgi:hypothetical protein